ncbi:MAG: site-specific integrase [Salinisphaeraceae bacterium]|nr:site-specific integrase [Salinisphaeraceae bacterium]
MERFLLFCQARGTRQLAAVTRALIEAYMATLARQGMAIATRRRKLFALKSFFAWLKTEGHIGTDPAEAVIPPER